MPKRQGPRSAWIVMGNERSWLGIDDLNEIRRDRWRWIWNTSPHCEEGDLLFFYYVAPRKAVHFLAHAACAPYFERAENAVAEHNPHQWWVALSDIVAITPISFARLCKAANGANGGLLNLRGQSGKYLRTDAANELLSEATIEYPLDQAASNAIRIPVHRGGLPEIATMDLAQIAAIPSGLLKVESHVEEYVVDPLLRLMGAGTPGWRVNHQVRVGRGIADRVVEHAGQPVCVVEVKRRIRLGQGRDWACCADVEQADGYASRLDVGFLLIDSDLIAGFAAGARQPSFEFSRHDLDARRVDVIRQFILM